MAGPLENPSAVPSEKGGGEIVGGINDPTAKSRGKRAGFGSPQLWPK